jgi:hypothetical protein
MDLSQQGLEIFSQFIQFVPTVDIGRQYLELDRPYSLRNTVPTKLLRIPLVLCAFLWRYLSHCNSNNS